MKGRKARDKILSRTLNSESEPLPSTLSTHATRFKATQLFAPSARPSLSLLFFFIFLFFFLRARLAEGKIKLSVLARVL